jgi:hypothetical protein
MAQLLVNEEYISSDAALFGCLSKGASMNSWACHRPINPGSG